MNSIKVSITTIDGIKEILSGKWNKETREKMIKDFEKNIEDEMYGVFFDQILLYLKAHKIKMSDLKSINFESFNSKEE